MLRKALRRVVAVSAATLLFGGAFAGTAFADPAAPSPTPSPVPAGAPPCADATHTTICAIGHDPIGAAGQAASSAPGAVVGSIAGDATESFTRWVASGATYVLNQTGTWLQDTSPPQLNSSWWTQHYAAMRRLALLVMFPFLMGALIKAVARRDPGMMFRAFFVRAPLAFVLTGAAVVLTSVALSASDEMTTLVAGPAMSGEAFQFMHNLANSFTTSTANGNPTPLFLVAIAALLTVVAGLMMFLELLLRSGVIYIALLFTPIALAASVWPGAERWAKRLAETVVAAVLSKFVIVTVISLAAGALAADTAAARGGGSGGSGDGIGGLLIGVILLGLAAFAPYKVFRMLPGLESAAIHQMEGLRQRGVSGARAAASAPRDALDRLSRQRATEAGAVTGRMFRGAGQAVGIGATVMAGAALGGAALVSRQGGRAGTKPPSCPVPGTAQGTAGDSPGDATVPLTGTPVPPAAAPPPAAKTPPTPPPLKTNG